MQEKRDREVKKLKSNITPDLVRAALGFVSPLIARDEWARVAMAIKSEYPDSTGFDLFNEWSQGAGDAYHASDTRDTWRSIKSAGRVGVGTLIHLAQQGGFELPKGDRQTSKPDAAAAARLERERAERAAQEQARLAAAHEQAAEHAGKQWAQGGETGSSPYLARKGAQPYGVRFCDDGSVLVPMRDAEGRLWNVQRIAPERPIEGPEKRFIKGGRKSGLWHMVGELGKPAAILIAEGYATAASLHEATGKPVAVAFDAGNLAHVAKALRQLYPSAALVMCGDDDQATQARTGQNPGKAKASAAAKAVQGVAVFPCGLDDGASDFNDMHQAQGLDAVRQCVEQAMSDTKADPASKAGSSGKGSAPAPDESGPVWDRFIVSDEGVFFLESDQDGRQKAPQWVCSRLDVTARTRDEDGQGWGFLLEFADPLGKVRTWAMPARMLAGDGAEYRAALLNMGLRIASGASARNRLGQYLQSRQPEEVARCADRVGWHGKSYVLPRETLGNDGERIVYQVDGITDNPYKQRGTLDAWRAGVATRCVGNDRLLFAVSCAFAGTLVRPSGVDSGGFHLRGDSSCGKTTALRVAASVWGGLSYVQRWRTTDNALEAIAGQHCDGLLILDELAQVDPKAAGECAYMLANESGKGRSTRTGQVRTRLQWRLLFLSAGEISLSQHMAEGGKRSKAGQELRMADIPADAGSGLGLFNALHDHTSGAVLSAYLVKTCEVQHGTAGRAWLGWLVDQVDTLRDRTRDSIEQYAADWIPEAASGQVQRVGRRFALVAVAGELATEAGLTGWEPGEAARGVRACFDAWLASRGGIGNAEEAHMLRQVQRLLAERGAGNFAWWHRAADDRAPNPTERWGFRRLVDEEGKPIKSDSDHMREYGERMTPADGEGVSIEFFVFDEVFKGRLSEGFEPSAMARLLLKRGHLVPESGGRHLSRKERLPGLGHARVYRIKASILADDLTEL